MNLLYIADNGFSLYKGKYYCTPPNSINLALYGKYFDTIHIIARKNEYQEGAVEPLQVRGNVFLIKKNDFYSLYKTMKRHQMLYDAVLMRNGINGCFAGIFARLFHKPTIAYCGSDPYVLQRAKKSLFRKAIAPIWRSLERFKMSSADYAQYCTIYLLHNYPTQRPYLICSHTDIEINEKDLQDKIQYIKCKKSHYVIGMIGRLEENKGISTIIRAMEKLDNRYIFEFVGGGNPDAYLCDIKERKMEERMRFLGYWIDKQKIKTWLKTIDVYIQPSLSETLPRATIEAMSVGCPCVVSDVGGFSELVDQKYLIHPTDDEALAEKIRCLAEDEDEAVKMAEANFEKAKKFDRSVRDRKLDQFFFSVVDDLAQRKERYD